MHLIVDIEQRLRDNAREDVVFKESVRIYHGWTHKKHENSKLEKLDVGSHNYLGM